MKRFVFLSVVTVIGLALSLFLHQILAGEGAGAAGKSPAKFPVIVVLDENAPFHKFRGLYRRDDRAGENPEAWGYLDPDVAGAVQALEGRHRFRADHFYSAALRGFAAKLTAEQIQNLENDPMVAAVEADGTMSIIRTMSIIPQTLPWGIDRVDADVSSTLAGNGSGAVGNVNVYIIDTGIAVHSDLNRVRHINFAGDRKNTDCNGHGTHVAGTVAAIDNAGDVVGAAPGAPLTGVKVLGCSGSGWTSNVIKGVDWVTANAKKPAVANMSLGGGASNALDDAVRRSVGSGVIYALAAGNSGADACNSSPARAGAGNNNGIITTAATDSDNLEPSWSNFGPCVDLWGPGVNILSTRKGGGTTTMSGTSMASPHAAGVAALFLSFNTTAAPETVEGQLKTDSLSTGTVSKDGRSIRLVYGGKY